MPESYRDTPDRVGSGQHKPTQTFIRGGTAFDLQADAMSNFSTQTFRAFDVRSMACYII